MSTEAYRQPVAQYMAQLRAAAEAELKMHEDLVAAGWEWDAELRHYTHPDEPGTVVSY